MDKIEKYREIIKKALLGLTEGSYAPYDIKNIEVFDDKTGIYIIVQKDFETETINVLAFAELTDAGKVLLQDDSDDNIYDNLIKNGIEKTDIMNLYEQ